MIMFKKVCSQFNQMLFHLLIFSIFQKMRKAYCISYYENWQFYLIDIVFFYYPGAHPSPWHEARFCPFSSCCYREGSLGIRAQAREIINTYNDSLQILQSISERWRSSTKIYLLSNRNFFSSSSSEK